MEAERDSRDGALLFAIGNLWALGGEGLVAKVRAGLDAAQSLTTALRRLRDTEPATAAENPDAPRVPAWCGAWTDHDEHSWDAADGTRRVSGWCDGKVPPVKGKGVAPDESTDDSAADKG